MTLWSPSVVPFILQAPSSKEKVVLVPFRSRIHWAIMTGDKKLIWRGQKRSTWGFKCDLAHHLLMSLWLRPSFIYSVLEGVVLEVWLDLNKFPKANPWRQIVLCSTSMISINQSIKDKDCINSPTLKMRVKTWNQLNRVYKSLQKEMFQKRLYQNVKKKLLTVGRAWPGPGPWSPDGGREYTGSSYSAVPLPRRCCCYYCWCWDWGVPSGGWRTHRSAALRKKRIDYFKMLQRNRNNWQNVSTMLTEQQHSKVFIQSVKNSKPGFETRRDGK